MGRPNKKGRSTGGPSFCQLHHDMLDSAAWLSLSAQDQAVYIAVLRVYNGTNNGFLARGVRDLAVAARINKDTAGRCLERLVERGFIETVVPGGFSRKTRHATEWRLTAFTCNKTGRKGSRAFKDWQPEIQNTVRNQATTVPSFRTVDGSKTGHGPLVSDRRAPLRAIIGPLVSDTYTFKP